MPKNCPDFGYFTLYLMKNSLRNNNINKQMCEGAHSNTVSPSNALCHQSLPLPQNYTLFIYDTDACNSH